MNGGISVDAVKYTANFFGCHWIAWDAVGP
jgi:hypothetical protein